MIFTSDYVTKFKLINIIGIVLIEMQVIKDEVIHILSAYIILKEIAKYDKLVVS